MRCEEAGELITGLVDNELSAQERMALDSHLGACPRCQTAHRLELALKQSVRAASETVKAPAGLRERILAGGVTPPQTGDVGLAAKNRAWFLMPAWRPVLAAALVLLIFAPLSYFLWPTGNIALATFSTHERINAGESYKSLAPVADLAALKRELVAAVGGRFAPMGFDLSAMGLYPVAGFVQKINDRDVLVTVYQGEGADITCFTFLGSESDAPDGARMFHDPVKKINFYSFSSDGMNAVLHKEGDVICVMVSEMPSPDLLALMRDKARHA